MQPGLSFSLMWAIIDQLMTLPRITILRMSKMGSSFPSGHRGLDFVTTNSEKMTSVVTNVLSLSIGEILVTTMHVDTCRRLSLGKPRAYLVPFQHKHFFM